MAIFVLSDCRDGDGASGRVGLAAAGTALVIGGAPVIGVTAGVVVAGAVVTAAAGWAYETFVPQATREKIDEGIRDTWNGAKDKIGDAWDAVF